MFVFGSGWICIINFWIENDHPPSPPFWNFSENSSYLVAWPVPYLLIISEFRVQGMLFQQLYGEKSKQDTLWRGLLYSYQSKGRVTLPHRMNFLKGSKRQLTPTPNLSNGPYLWKSCAYYLAIIPPCICATTSIIKNWQHNFPKMRVGDQRLFGIFPFWWLSEVSE